MEEELPNRSEKPTRFKKRRRRSSGKYRKASKEAVRQCTAKLLAQANMDSDNSNSSSEDEIKRITKNNSSSIPSQKSKRFHNGREDLIAPEDGNHRSNPSFEGFDTTTLEFSRLHRPQKPSADVSSSSKGRNHTLSIAIPGNILNNAQTWELKTALVGQIARACAIFSVDEIIIFDENLPSDSQNHTSKPIINGRNKYRKAPYYDPAIKPQNIRGEEDGYRENDSEENFQPCHFFVRILEYLECPQYLRKSLFPLHPDLRLAGLLAPLDLPHHLRKDHSSKWREGCKLSRDVTQNYLTGKNKQLGKKRAQNHSKSPSGSVWVDVGLDEPVEVFVGERNGEGTIEDWTRVTVQMPTEKIKTAKLVSPRAPKEESGLYWGYSVRFASSISKVFTESPFIKEGGYDLTIGTSERGKPVDSVIDGIGNFKHLLLVLGGLSGLELCIASDSTLEPRLTAEESPLLFDYWINTLPFQGSRTIRTEEALLVSLGALRKLFFS